jgi:hypothetical protein
MSTIRVGTISNTGGTQSTAAENVINGSAKAWVNFNGTGTVAIRAGYNVSSITDRGVGRYSVNFTTAMIDANYSVCCAGRKSDTNEDGWVALATGASNLVQTASISYISTRDGNASPIDLPQVNVAVFR